MTAQDVDESIIYACGIEMMGNLVGDEQVATDSTIGTEAEDFTSKIERRDGSRRNPTTSLQNTSPDERTLIELCEEQILSYVLDA